MKKVSILLIAILMLAACSQERTQDEIKDEIFDYKEKIKTLENELKELSNGEIDNLIKVNTMEVKKEKTIHTFTVTGTAKAENIAYISPEMNGQITRIYVKEGQFVKKGQSLVSLNTNIVQNQIKEARTGLELARTMYEKQKSLWEQNIGKEVDYLQAKSQKESMEARLGTLNAQLGMGIIRAPFSGIVDEIYFKQGEMASPGRQIIDLVNLNNIEIEADISEKYLPYIKKGDSVNVNFPTYPDMEKIAIIERTGNIINPANRTFKITVKIDNKDKVLKPNMLAEIILSDYEGNDIAIPSIIIRSDRKGEFIFVVNTKDSLKVAEKRYVITGLHTNGNTIIESGLKEGEKVITGGYNMVTNGSKIKIVK